jgi:RNA binding exosome subunit
MSYISTEDVKKIRVALKNEFGKKLKFGVRKSPSHHSVSVTIKSGTVDFSDIMSNTYDQVQVNHYHLQNYGVHKSLFEKIVEIIKTAPSKKWYNNSDAMIDYFDVAFYFDLNVGDWDNPYKKVA